MTTVFYIDANEINMDFTTALRNLFKDKKITVTVDVDMDETEYLLRSKANKKMLLKSLKQAETGKVKKVSMNELK